MHARVIKLNQNCYREFRGNPTPIPFRNIFVDYLGPFNVRFDYKNKETKKIWILVVCCLWSRAINLHVCYDFSSTEFLKALQTQVFQFGLPSLCISDSSTQILSAAKKINKYIFNNQIIQDFMKEQSIEYIEFQSYPKGNHSLGGLIETCNRMIRKILYGSVRNLILNVSDLNFVVSKVISILNKRPLTFKETLRTNSELDVPETITPEMLLYGRPLNYLSIIPEFYPADICNLDCDNIDYVKELEKLKKLSARISELYTDQFMQNLVLQSTNKKDLYRSCAYNDLKIGDLVLIKEDLLKPHQYPLARVINLTRNTLNEVTEVMLIKGNKEIVRRHVFAIIPMISLVNEDRVDNMESDNEEESRKESSEEKPKRKVASEALEKIKTFNRHGLV